MEDRAGQGGEGRTRRRGQDREGRAGQREEGRLGRRKQAPGSKQCTVGRGQWARTERQIAGIWSVLYWNLISRNFDFVKFDVFY